LGDPPIYDPGCFEDPECRHSLIQREITDSIFAFAWAPDGGSIAFVAQRESASSNIYIYQISDNTIHPLTNELENIHTLEWAPNGQSILYKISAAPGLGFEGSQWRLMDRNGTPIPFSSELSSEFSRWDGDRWLNENVYLMLQFTDVDPAFSRFLLLNTDTGHVKEIWADHAYSYAVNHENQTIVLIHRDYESQPSKTSEGVYVVYPDGKNQKLSDVGYYLVLVEGQKPYPVLIEDYDRGFHSINDDGSITPLPWNGVPRISPDGNLFLIKKEQELTLYDSSHQALKSWLLKDRASISWSRDSRGVFLFDSVNVYYLSITSDEPKPLFEDCTLKYCPPVQYVWTP
jgi:dipeptidyl aminopeptidase/acylaminoacyl peptidase